MLQDQSQLQEMGSEQLLARHGRNWRSVIVNAVVDSVKGHVDAVLCKAELSELKEVPQGLEHAVARITREIVMVIGNDLMNDIIGSSTKEAAATMMDRINGEAEGIASDIVNHWAASAELYIPLDNSFGRGKYDEFREKLDKAPANERPHDHVPALQEAVDDRFRALPSDSYDVVRTARHRPAVLEDVPRIVASYRSALLSNDMLELLVRKPGATMEHSKKAVEKYGAMMKTGRFIWDESIEKDGTRVPMEATLAADLSGKSYREKGMAFRIRMLEATRPVKGEENKLLAWMSYLHNDLHGDRKTSKRQRKTVIDYLNRGVTGRMTYDKESTPLETFEHGADYAQLFHDVRSHWKDAVLRLGALEFERMFADNHKLSYIYAYRLRDLFIHPPLDLIAQTRDQGILPAWNDSSGVLFGNKWGFRPVAIDFNAGKHAPLAKRHVGGMERTLNPKWEVMAAKMDKVVQMSRQQWRKVQLEHGDVSNDYPKSF